VNGDFFRRFGPNPHLIAFDAQDRDPNVCADDDRVADAPSENKRGSSSFCGFSGLKL
jgi:hypothetical protein